MGTSKILRSADQRSIVSRRVTMLVIAVMGLVAGYGMFGRSGGTVAAQSGNELQGMGKISGTVTATKPFKAAQVYLRNVDKRMLYMVYTNAGAFRAVALFPGNYEVNVQAKGLVSDVQKIVVKAGDNPALKVTLKDAASPNRFPTSVEISTVSAGNGAGWTPNQPVTLHSYEEIYPPGPGREVLEKVCMNCHGENAFAMRPRSGSAWKLGLDMMMGVNLANRDKERFGEGTLAAPSNFPNFGLQDRKDLLDYLTKNLGLDKKPRAVRPDKDVPLDEAELGKAQIIEYYLADERPNRSAAAGAGLSDSESDSAGTKGLRVAITLQLDADGNVWAVDRGVPSRLVKLNPRTGEQKDYVLLDPKAGVHEILIDREGIVWVPEFNRPGDGPGSNLVPRLLGFSPKTERWEHVIESDPDNVIRNKNKGQLMSGSVDSKGNIYMNWMLNGAIAKYDRAKGRVSVFLIPTPNAVPYGQTIDKNDNVWVSEWNGGKFGKFDTTTGQWSEFAPLTYPANLRRGINVDSQNNIWSGIWAAGNRPAKLARLDQTTGRFTEWSIPYRGSQPYETSADREDNIWFPDTGTPGRPSVIGRFNPRTGTFTFYPKPQYVADSSKLQHAADGAVWYAPRYGATFGTSGFAILFPDKDKITTLAPRPLNGVPGYPFKVASSTRANR